ncbi:MAG: hypothetical protein ABH848_02715 [Candidatus Omnitrophota bacterium]
MRPQSLVNKALIVFLLLFFLPINVFSAETIEKDPSIIYIKDIASIITEVDILIRDIQFNSIPTSEGAKRLGGHIKKLDSLSCPKDLEELHNKVRLSFKKIRLGFLLLSKDRREVSVRLVKNGAVLLKSAALEIKRRAKEKGMIKKQEN